LKIWDSALAVSPSEVGRMGGWVSERGGGASVRMRAISACACAVRVRAYYLVHVCARSRVVTPAACACLTLAPL
jgi:hypothetical protein